MEYELLCADNIEMKNAKVKATFTDKKQAIQALYSEIEMAKAQRHIQDGCMRFTMFDGFVSVDYGSWSDFIGLTGVTINDF